MKLSPEELARRARVSAQNSMYTAALEQKKVAETVGFEEETRDVAEAAARLIANTGRAFMDPAEHPSVKPAVLIDIHSQVEFRAGIQIERVRQVEKGYTEEADAVKGPVKLLSVAQDYVRRGKLVEAAAIMESVKDLLKKEESE